MATQQVGQFGRYWPPAYQNTLMTFGDSMGRNLIMNTLPWDMYPEQAARQLRKQGLPWSAVNLNIAGTSSSEILYQQIARAQAQPTAPTVVVIDGGINDFAYSGALSLSVNGTGTAGQYFLTLSSSVRTWGGLIGRTITCGSNTTQIVTAYNPKTQVITLNAPLTATVTSTSCTFSAVPNLGATFPSVQYNLQQMALNAINVLGAKAVLILNTHFINNTTYDVTSGTPNTVNATLTTGVYGTLRQAAAAAVANLNAQGYSNVYLIDTFTPLLNFALGAPAVYAGSKYFYTAAQTTVNGITQSAGWQVNPGDTVTSSLGDDAAESISGNLHPNALGIQIGYANPVASQILTLHQAGVV